MSLKEILTPERINQALEKTLQEVDIKHGKLTLITKEHYDKAMTFFADELLPDEPMCSTLGVGLSTTMRELALEQFSQNMSLMLLDPTNGDVMAIRVIGLANADDDLSMETIDDIPTKKALAMYKYCEDRAEAFKRYNTKEMINFFGLGVAAKYRKQGFATKLMEAALVFIQNFGVSPVAVKGAASSAWSARVYDKLGFDLLDELRYEDYVVDGKRVIRDTGEHVSVRSYGKVM